MDLIYSEHARLLAQELLKQEEMKLSQKQFPFISLIN